MSHHQNLVRIKVVHKALEELGNQVVFIGGTIGVLPQTFFQAILPYDKPFPLIRIIMQYP